MRARKRRKQKERPVARREDCVREGRDMVVVVVRGGCGGLRPERRFITPRHVCPPRQHPPAFPRSISRFFQSPHILLLAPHRQPISVFFLSGCLQNAFESVLVLNLCGATPSFESLELQCHWPRHNSQQNRVAEALFSDDSKH